MSTGTKNENPYARAILALLQRGGMNLKQLEGAIHPPSERPNLNKNLFSERTFGADAALKYAKLIEQEINGRRADASTDTFHAPKSAAGLLALDPVRCAFSTARNRLANDKVRAVAWIAVNDPGHLRKVLEDLSAEALLLAEDTSSVQSLAEDMQSDLLSDISPGHNDDDPPSRRWLAGAAIGTGAVLLALVFWAGRLSGPQIVYGPEKSVPSVALPAGSSPSPDASAPDATRGMVVKLEPLPSAMPGAISFELDGGATRDTTSVVVHVIATPENSRELQNYTATATSGVLEFGPGQHSWNWDGFVQARAGRTRAEKVKAVVVTAWSGSSASTDATVPPPSRPKGWLPHIERFEVLKDADRPSSWKLFWRMAQPTTTEVLILQREQVRHLGGPSVSTGSTNPMRWDGKFNGTPFSGIATAVFLGHTASGDAAISRVISNDSAGEPTCSDGTQNGSETGLDCGGSCTPCVPPSCLGNPQCASESCCTTISIPGGTFDRGSTSGYSDEQPEIAVTVSPFTLDKFEVSMGRLSQFQSQWTSWRGEGNPKAGTGAHPAIPTSGWDPSWDQHLSTPPSPGGDTFCVTGTADEAPVACLTWYEALAFCIWDGGRLPTSAEWEYVAAGGSEDRLYPWGASPPDPTLAVYSDGSSQNSRYQVAVGAKPAGQGRWGHLDLAGGRSEWVLDNHASNYSDGCGQDCFFADGASSLGEARGGSWKSPEDALRASYRSFARDRSVRDDVIGFRCAR